MASLRKVDQQPTSDLHRLDAMRLWLVSGVHFVDPRRRFGSHGRARELLVAEQSVSHASERWHALAAALHRHTVRGGLSELRPDERHVITLAYLEGRTNREIAALLGVSVTTVQRRLLFALGRLEAYIGRTGVWLSALVLVAATYAIRPGPRLVRWVATTAGSPDRAQRVATTLTAGAMSAAVLGIVAFTSDSAMPSTPPLVATAPIVTQIHVGAPLVTSIGSQISQPSAVQPTLVVEGTTTATTDRDLEGTSPNPRRHHNNGCHHNPTSAPPPVPVGSATSHPTGAPVTHPGAGGCRANGG